MTKQPEWQCIANLGDASPIEHGGCFVMIDTTKVYPAEMEVWIPSVDDDGTKGTAYRIILDQLVYIRGENLLINARIYKDWLAGEELPHPIPHYNEWFASRAVAVNVQTYLSSDDPVDRAVGYRELCEYTGYYTFDQYPLKFTEEEARERYIACNAIVEGA